MDGWNCNESKVTARLSLSIHREHVSHEMVYSSEIKIKSELDQIYCGRYFGHWRISLGRSAANSAVDERI